MRAALGNPGSVRRWLVGSVVLFLGVTFVAIVTGNVLVFIPGVMIAGAAFVLRMFIVGDEDELRAEYLSVLAEGKRMRAESFGRPEHETAPPEEWLSGPNRFTDAPPPPVAEMDGPVE